MERLASVSGEGCYSVLPLGDSTVPGRLPALCGWMEMGVLPPMSLSSMQTASQSVFSMVPTPHPLLGLGSSVQRCFGSFSSESNAPVF